MLYEIHHYSAPDTTALGALTTWFSEHVVPAWKAVDMRVVGCFTATIGRSPRLTTITACEDLNQRMATRERLTASDQWKSAYAALYANGDGLISGVDTAILRLTDYSPDPFTFHNAAAPGLFEERIYRGKTSRTMARVNQRFEEYTVRLFNEHGITPVAFWNVIIGADQPSLYYLVRYDSLSQRQPAWDSFRADPEWQQAYKESESAGPILLRTDSAILTPTPFSPMK